MADERARVCPYGYNTKEARLGLQISFERLKDYAATNGWALPSNLEQIEQVTFRGKDFLYFSVSNWVDIKDDVILLMSPESVVVPGWGGLRESLVVVGKEGFQRTLTSSNYQGIVDANNVSRTATSNAPIPATMILDVLSP
jgi:hypothetical protein